MKKNLEAPRISWQIEGNRQRVHVIRGEATYNVSNLKKSQRAHVIRELPHVQRGQFGLQRVTPTEAPRCMCRPHCIHASRCRTTTAAGSAGSTTAELLPPSSQPRVLAMWEKLVPQLAFATTSSGYGGDGDGNYDAGVGCVRVYVSREMRNEKLSSPYI
ncbi:hypothetical protein PIB30_077342 [Stylosanthes scabra]|uniref:Uncharacterized protein n=1 Tax=Stylosanthes scabra TaxID=79078 RepID=A0ABU6QQN4_9FABA|nr:hypothetical protein [Stylosanthes scabra]